MDYATKVKEFYAGYARIIQEFIPDYQPEDEYESINMFITCLGKYLDVSKAVALDIWYGRQRSWWDDRMIEHLVQLDGSPSYPRITSGEFDWSPEKGFTNEEEA